MSGKAMLYHMRSGGTILRHSEYITDLRSPANQTAFTATTPFTLNIGNANTFPWGSTVALNFQQYKFKRIVFEFRSLTSDSIVTNGSGALGSVIMGTKYDALDAAFYTKAEMENYEYTNSCKPSCNLFHTINTRGIGLKKFFVRAANNSSTSGDARLFDLGNFTIATAGLQSATGTILGEIWVHYEVVLYKPELEDMSTLWDFWSSGTGAGATKFGNADAAEKAGATMDGSIPNSGTTNGYNGAGTVTVNNNNSYLFPPNLSMGTFLVNMFWTGGGVTLGTPVFTPFSTINNVTTTTTSFTPSITTAAVLTPAAGTATCTAASYTVVLTLNGPGAGFTFDAAQLVPTGSWKMWVTQLSGSYVNSGIN